MSDDHYSLVSMTPAPAGLVAVFGGKDAGGKALLFVAPVVALGVAKRHWLKDGSPRETEYDEGEPVGLVLEGASLVIAEAWKAREGRPLVGYGIGPEAHTSALTHARDLQLVDEHGFALAEAAPG